MTNTAECVECGQVSVSPDGRWKPGEACLFGMLFACNRQCAEAWATKNAAPGHRPGEPGFTVKIEGEEP